MTGNWTGIVVATDDDPSGIGMPSQFFVAGMPVEEMLGKTAAVIIA
jgi:hypothetical protein